MKRIFTLLLTVVLFLFALNYAYALTITDDFNDGNADGWWLGYQQGAPWVPGNWRVEDGMLVQDRVGDNFIATYEGKQLSAQEVQADFRFNNDSGYGGLILWYKNDSNWVYIRLYPGVGGLWFSEDINSTYTNTFYTYVAPNTTWFTVKAVANASGNIDVYVNGNYVLSHQTITSDRYGKSGVFNGNSGGYIDNFVLTEVTTTENKDKCKGDGWMSYENPLFKNQGDCVSYVQRSANTNGNKTK